MRHVNISQVAWDRISLEREILRYLYFCCLIYTRVAGSCAHSCHISSPILLSTLTPGYAYKILGEYSRDPAHHHTIDSSYRTQSSSMGYDGAIRGERSRR